MLKSKIVLFTILILCVLSASCKKSSDMISIESSNESIGSYNFDRQKLKDEATYVGDVIVNAESVKMYANVVLQGTLGKDLNDYKEVTVMLDSNNKVWVVNYGIGEETVGGDISIAISRKTGEILKIWFGE